MTNTKMYDTKNVLKQYKDGKNLSTRISLYEKYGTNKKTVSSWIYESYEFFNGCKILELGSGTGKDWKYNISKLPKNCSLILSDFTQGMVDELKTKFSALDNVQLKQIDIQDIPFNDNSFDFVIANSMLYHVPDIDKALKEVSRVLKPKGTFYAGTIGSKSMFQYLKESLPNFCKEITISDSISFTLQNGSEYLNKYYSDIKIAIYKNRVEITNTKDLVNYIYSVPSIEGLKQCDRGKIFDYYESKKNDNGFIAIDIEAGMFIAGN